MTWVALLVPPALLVPLALPQPLALPALLLPLALPALPALLSRLCLALPALLLPLAFRLHLVRKRLVAQMKKTRFGGSFFCLYMTLSATPQL